MEACAPLPGECRAAARSDNSRRGEMSGMHHPWRAGATGLTLAVAVLLIISPVPVSASAAGSAERTPIVLFPALHFTSGPVTVHHPTVAPGSPRLAAFTASIRSGPPPTPLSPRRTDE